MLMTGEEFAELVPVDREAIDKKRKEDQQRNLQYIYRQMENILKEAA